jgi:hypothetical protein
MTPMMAIMMAMTIIIIMNAAMTTSVVAIRSVRKLADLVAGISVTKI